MNITSLLCSNNWLVYNKEIAKKLGVNEAILIGELCSEYTYWKDHNKLSDGGFFSSADNIQNNTALSPYQQREALKHLQELNLLKIQLKGIPATRWIFLDFEELTNLLLDDLKTSCKESNQQVEEKLEGNNNKKNNKDNNISENSNKPKKEIKDSTRSVINLINFINSLNYPVSLKEELLKWYMNIAKGRVSISQLKDKIIDIENACNHDTNKIEQAVKAAYLNGWFGFFATKTNSEGKKINPNLCFTPDDKLRKPGEIIELSEETW